MGLLQKALETYHAMEGLAGVYQEGLEPLAPVGHIVTKAQIEVTIDADGRFVEAKPADKDKKIIIPVTEESSGRTSAPAAHPLCDQLGYLLPEGKEKYDLYIAGLKEWVNSPSTHPKAAAVLQYVQRGTMRDDLTAAGISLANEKALVCWRVIGLGESSGPVWTDVALMKAYAAYYLSIQEKEHQLCMLTGEETSTTWQHLKGVFSLNGNAKIISANDSTNFTYRGRFVEPGQAASLGYLASQKAHNALKWLISTQGDIQGRRAFVCWNPRGLTVPPMTKPTLYRPGEEQPPPIPTYKNYKEELHSKLTGFLREWQPSDQVVVAAFDAATTGRLAVTYYNELLGSDFLERLVYWDETFCWVHARLGVHSPTLHHVIAYAFGTEQDKGRVEPDEKIIAPQMQRLLSCRIDQAAFPVDIMHALVTRAGNLQAYKIRNNRTMLLTIACAAVRKYHIDHSKEEIQLALEPERKDISYQWGRLLAVMEKIERDTYGKDEDKRETNAIRLQSVFSQRPGYATKMIIEQLKTAYYPKLKIQQRTYYDKLIAQIMEKISADMEHYDAPLTETYLPGYYLQRSALYTSNSEKAKAEEE